MKTILQPYRKDGGDTYASGAYAAIELIRARPEKVKTILIHSAYAGEEHLRRMCEQRRIPVVCDDRAFVRLNQKENSYVLAVCEKYEARLSPDEPHIVLVNPADMGNLGTIARAMAGFGFLHLALVTPAADIWNPKAVRASMGALFHVNVCHFESFARYRAAFPGHALFPFMLGGELELGLASRPQARPYALVFGNEAAGLDPSFAGVGTSVRIPQTGLVDSLNLAVAAAVGMYAFSSQEYAR
ncbi:MAG TPA: TrmH family RNA methyltransferase [Clostridia bacterium]|nr:TrmH family RNA methyltransferase [Clostridia bacterium]